MVSTFIAILSLYHSELFCLISQNKLGQQKVHFVATCHDYVQNLMRQVKLTVAIAMATHPIYLYMYYDGLYYNEYTLWDWGFWSGENSII